MLESARKYLVYALLLFAWLPAISLAAPVGTVDAVFTKGPKGGWTAVLSGGELQRDGQRRVLTVGLRLEEGDVLQTDADTRLRLRLRGDEQVVVAEGASLTLTEPRSLLQDLGSVLYRVHGIFRVRYRSVEAAVEGTRFVVYDPDGVHILAGRVAVSGNGARQVGTRRTWVATPNDTPQKPVSTDNAVMPPPVRLVRHLGPPRSSLGLEAGGGALGPEGIGALRLVGRFAFVPMAEVWFEGGFASGQQRIHVPVAAGLGVRWGWLRVGLGGSLRIGPCEFCDGDGAPIRALGGGHGQVGLLAPITVRLAWSVTGRGEIYVDRMAFDLSAGLALGF